MTLDELFDLYCKKKLRSSSPNTVRLYKHSLKAFEKTLGRSGTVTDLNDDNLESHIWRLLDAGRSPSTANKDNSQIGAMWRFANRNRLVDTWPNVPLIPIPETIPLGWTQEELDRLLATVSKLDGKISGAPASLWWRSLINLMLDTGERIGAIRDLDKSHLHGDHILVPAKFRKGRKRDRLYKMDQQTINDLSILMSLHRKDLLHPWDRSLSYIYNRLDTILVKANLPNDEKSKFHRFRRTVASAVANQGGNPTSALDHSSPKVTQRYLDPRIVQEKSTSSYVSAWRNSGKSA